MSGRSLHALTKYLCSYWIGAPGVVSDQFLVGVQGGAAEICTLCSVSASSTKEHQHQGATIPALYHLEVKTGAVLLKRWC